MQIDTSKLHPTVCQKASRDGKKPVENPSHYHPPCKKLSCRHYELILFLTLLIFSLTMDTEMSDPPTLGKQMASPGATTKHKKVTLFAEIHLEEDVVSTTANHNITNQGFEDLTESMVALARSPYKRLHGQDMGDEKAFHNDLNVILIAAGKWLYDTNQLAQDQLKKIMEALAIAQIITTAM
jgi:hypothetical protein